MKNNSHWKFKAQHCHVFTAVSECLKYDLLTGCSLFLFFFLQKIKKKQNHTFGEEEAISKTFHILLCLKVVTKLSDSVWKSVPVDSEVDNTLSLKEKESHVKNFTPKPLKTTPKRKRRKKKAHKTFAYIWIN